MKQIYTKEIIQYSQKGEKINQFKDRHEAFKQTGVHVDSIISCCNGKYKTAGGFIFRFEGDKFKLKQDKGEHTCKICGSEESVRSMAMHLRWSHNIKTEEYVSQYGEFRPKKLKENKLKEKSNIECKECGEKLNSNQHLMYHITKFHPNITQNEYILKHMYGNNIPLCKCGCGEPVTLLRNGKNCDLGKETYNRDYIKGHLDWDVFINNSNQSREEIEILDYIKSIYKEEIQTSVRNIINPYELDIVLPNLKIAIEYNGLYWHCEKNNISKNYHKEKTLKCKEKGYRLIHIFADEWYDNKELVKLKLKNILKLNNKKIFARKCIIKEISIQEKDNFLEINHIQGKDKSKIKLGLFYDTKLVGVMTFTNPRIALGAKNNDKNVWELSRYASSINIVGGASKLLKHFIKTINPKQIYSYSDNRWTDWDNNMYLSIGFKRTKISNPNYWYTKNFIERIHRYNFRKQKLKQQGFDISKTEKEIMEERKYYRIWDCGTTKYELTL